MDIPFWVAIPIVALFIPISAIVIDGMQKIKEREQQHRERLKAMELGVTQPLAAWGPPEDNQQKARSRGPGFYGAIWTGIGLGLLVSTLVVDAVAREDGIARFANFLMLWAFPALGVGLGLVIYAAVSRRSA